MDFAENKWTASSRNRTRGNYRLTPYTAGLQTATVDVNHIHTARYFVQLFVVPIYICLKAHEASNSVLSLYSLAEELSSSSRMIKYWMLIMKFQMDYVVFIRSMSEGHFEFLDKTLMSLVIWFFVFDQYSSVRWLR